MGNCINKQSSTEWAGEDWEYLASSNSDQHKASTSQENGGVTVTETEVKIKITKKQLEELLGKADVQGLTMEHVLIEITDQIELNQRAWKPALQSIPEND